MSRPFFLRVQINETTFRDEMASGGVPLVNLNGDATNYEVLRRWIGRRAAIPLRESTGQSSAICFSECDDNGLLMPTDTVEPLSASDATGRYKEQLDQLDQAIDKATPNGPGETRLKERFLATLRAARERPSNAGFYFFKCKSRDIIWCWGYRRVSAAPESPVICRECRTLGFKDRDCLNSAAHQRREVAPRASRRRWYAAATVIAAVLLMAAAVPFLLPLFDSDSPPAPVVPPDDSPTVAAGPTLIVTPSDAVALPLGTRQSFRVERVEGPTKEDVTSAARLRVDDFRVVRPADDQGAIEAVGTGKAEVRVEYGNLQARVTVTVTAERPRQLRIEPEQVELGVGTTTALKLMGVYADGREADLSPSATWRATDADRVFVYYGVLQGKTPGETQITASYELAEASADSGQVGPATARAIVLDERYVALSAQPDPATLGVGEFAEVHAKVTTTSGVERNVDGSSELRLTATPAGRVEISDGRLKGLSEGKATLIARFRDLEFTTTISVEARGPSAPFEVTPTPLRLAVGEELDLSVSGAASGLTVASSHPEVVDASDTGRVVGLRAGEAVLRVSAGNSTLEVPATVVDESFESLRLSPSPIVVPLFDTVPVEVWARTAGPEVREVRLSNDGLEWTQLPPLEDIEFDIVARTLRGRRVTETPRALSVRRGELEASVDVSVIAPPLAVELSPRGSVELPVEQSLSLRAAAVFGNGRRVELPADRVSWEVAGGEKHAKWTPGVVGAIAAGGELTVRARFEGQVSDVLTIRTVAAATDVRLALDDFDAPLFVGSQGQFRLRATGDAGALTLDASGARFSSSAAEVLAVDAATGSFVARTPGVATITVEHPAAAEPATREVTVVDPLTAKLALRPQSVRLAVGTQDELRLVWVDDQGREVDCTSRSDVAWHVGDDAAVEWLPPTVTGRRPAPTVAITARLGGQEAVAMIEVVAPPPPTGVAASAADSGPNADRPPGAEASDSPGASEAVNEGLRVTPAEVTLATLDSLAPSVERQLEDGTWVRVRPDLVQWDVPAGLQWSEARESVPPRVTIPPGTQGDFTLAARFEGRAANLKLTVDPSQAPIDPNDPEAELIVERDPPGRVLPVRAEQRFRVLARKGDRTSEIPEDQVTWQAPFENDSVRWQPPLVTALAGGHRQALNVEVSGKLLAFEVETAAGSSAAAESPPAESAVETPAALRIEADTPGTVALGLGMTYDRFRVLALTSDGEPARDITAEATILIDSADSAVSFEAGRFVAQRVGRATAKASFGGLTTDHALEFQVDSQVKLTRIDVRPAAIQLAPDDSGRFFADGYDGARFVGNLNRHPGLVWQVLRREGAEQVVRVDGALVTAVGEGRAGVTAQLDGVISEAAEVVVSTRSSPRDELLRIDPATLVLRRGETRILGGDVRVSHRGLDVVDRLEVVSSNDAVVRYDPVSRTLSAGADGRATISLVQGRARGKLEVRVGGDGESAFGAGARLHLEPGQATLVVGQTQNFRVIVVDDLGQRVDRTAAAVFRSSDESIASMRGGTARADGAGEAIVEVMVEGIAEPAQAPVRVTTDQLTEFQVEPTRLNLAVGQTSAIRVSAVGQGVRRELNGHARLRFAVDESPTFLEIDSSGRIHGLGTGATQVNVLWNDQTIGSVSVDVRADALERIEIIPRQIELDVGAVHRFQVFAWRGNVRRPVAMADGVTLVTSNPSSVAALEGLGVQAMAPGICEVVAQLGIQRAAAIVRVRNNGPSRLTPANGELPGSAVTTETLSFERSVIRLSPDGLPQSVRVVRQLLDGRRQDVSLAAQLTIAPAANADIVRLASVGASITPQATGVTHVLASWQGLTTVVPLRIEVREASGQARLRLSPNPLVIRAGETGWFYRAEILTDDGHEPRAVPVTLSTDSPEIVTISGLNILARREGFARVTARVALADHLYAELETSAVVEVQRDGGTPNGDFAAEPAGLGAPGTSANPATTTGDVAGTSSQRRGERRQLLLSGPDRTWVGARVGFAVNVLEGSRGWPVTEAAELIVQPAVEAAPGQDLPARSLGAGGVEARRAGRVQIQARWGDLVSNAIVLRIDDIAGRFAELRIAIDDRPMRIGESRTYRVLGVPADGGAVQDLTGLVGLDRATSRVFVGIRNPSQVSHQPPRITAQTAGDVELLAVSGDTRSARVRIPVVDVTESVEARPTSLRIDPARRVLRRGETCPPWTVWAQYPGESAARAVAAELSSQDPSVLRALEGTPGSFVAAGTGDSRVVATWAGLTAEATVSVVGGAFESVEIVQQQDSPNFEFTVRLRVRGAATSGVTEYRLLKDEQAAARSWTKATASENPAQIEATMLSPSFPSRLDQVFRLTIEGRDERTGRLARYPYLFRFQPQAANESTSPARR